MSSAKPNQDRGMSQPVFIVVVSVLLVSVIAFYTAKDRLGLVFKKAPVPQPHEFKTIPARMNNWMQVSIDEQLNPNIEESLGTEKYLYRDYVRLDQDEYGADFIEAINSIVKGEKGDRVSIPSATKTRVDKEYKDANTDERAGLIQEAIKDQSPEHCKLAVSYVQGHHPQGIMNVGLTYYTGLVDTVAHVPDRCYIADGYDFTDSQQGPSMWDLGNDSAGRHQTEEVRLMHFEDQTGSQRVPKTVCYFFNVDGVDTWSPLKVRMQLQSLTQKYGYYAKIELMQVGEDKGNAAADSMGNFLTSVRPQIQTCLPDWDKVNKQPPPK